MKHSQRHALVFHVSAADHEDQRLAAPLWDLGEVVVKVADRLVVDEELQRRLRGPLRALRGHLLGTHRGQVGRRPRLRRLGAVHC